MLDASIHPALERRQPDTRLGAHGCGCNGATEARPASKPLTSLQSGPGWCAVLTNPQAERWAEANLRRIGYAVFLPLARIQRRDPVIRSQFHNILVPLFSRYLFALHDPRESWRPIYETPGVHSVLKTNATLCYARPGAVEALQASEAARRCAEPPGGRKRPGDALQFAHGPFRGLDCIVVAAYRHHAQVSAIVMGALRTVTAPLSWLAERT